ncbi:hypothetical protein [Engelhardtia mirabilis]|uniref:Uncharacterized protein n=1 Tax=Engelhardtia mirabilis TaxID=2528011 RepID=A0A518BDH3_9BACT|nr:hypothetical protein Pla133_00650 [Planctomycetes bacterium Pla133]QDU99328.1 hypothetical protein Pla86_00650 [Planctomycetes bacterium Pla86]
MSQGNDEQPFERGNLESPAYRQRLMRKLNCLIAVLEVACAKVRRSMDGPEPDLDRLTRIQKNLTQTLDVCKRAKGALERREQLPGDLPGQLAEISSLETLGGDDSDYVVRPHRGRMVEMQSASEADRFEQMGPISGDEFQGLDLEDLTRRLQDG